jgi:hypothetical protein
MNIMCRFHGGPKDGAEELREDAPYHLVFVFSNLPERIDYVRFDEEIYPQLLPRNVVYERVSPVRGNAVVDYRHAP